MWLPGIDVGRWNGSVTLRLGRAVGDERVVAVGEARLLVDRRPSLTAITWPDEADALSVIRPEPEHDRDADHGAVWLTESGRGASARTERLGTSTTGLTGTVVLHRAGDGRIVGIEFLTAAAQMPPQLLVAIEVDDPHAPVRQSVYVPTPRERPGPPPEPTFSDRWNAALDDWAERHRWVATLGSAAIAAGPVAPAFLWAGEPLSLALIAGATIFAMIVAVCLALSKIEGRPVVPVPFRNGSEPTTPSDRSGSAGRGAAAPERAAR